MGEAINLVNNFKVDKVIFNCGSYNGLEKELIKVLDKRKIKHYSCIKELNIDKNKLYFLQTKEYDNENDNSNVIYTELNGYKFMFMGDASTTTEKEILSKYNLSDVDVLKVGHHGSKTSSSREFINEVNRNYSIISVGKNNRYGHPNKEVLDNLEDSKIYRTDQDGSIMFKIKDYKKINRKLEENLNVRNNRLDKAISDLDEKMKTTKNIPFNKNQVIVNKDTFDTMNKIVKESKKVIELQPKIKEVFNEINGYASGYKTLENENKNIRREVQVLEYRNNQLEKENNKLNDKIQRIIKAIK